MVGVGGQKIGNFSGRHKWMTPNAARTIFRRNSVSGRLYGAGTCKLIHVKSGTHYCRIPIIPYWLTHFSPVFRFYTS